MVAAETPAMPAIHHPGRQLVRVTEAVAHATSTPSTVYRAEQGCSASLLLQEDCESHTHAVKVASQLLLTGLLPVHTH